MGTLNAIHKAITRLPLPRRYCLHATHILETLHFTSSRGASWASAVSAALTSQQWHISISAAYDNVYAVSDLTTDADKLYQLYFEYSQSISIGKIKKEQQIAPRNRLMNVLAHSSAA